MKHITLILLAVALLAVTAPTAVASQPDNYCTTVEVIATTTGYDVTATGAGRYARIRDLTTATTVPGTATDFGLGATVYTWTGLLLDPTHQYQVQISHTSLTTGYSTTGCIFTPPPSLGVVMGLFTATANGLDVALRWETMSEWNNLGFDVYRGAAGLFLDATFLAHVPSPIPGGTFGQMYAYDDLTLEPGVYWYWVVSVDTNMVRRPYGPVSVLVQAPTAVTLGSFTAAGGVCKWQRKPRLRCECGKDNPYSPWYLCIRR